MNSKGGVQATPPAIRSIGSIDPYALKILARAAESSFLFQFHILIFTLSQRTLAHLGSMEWDHLHPIESRRPPPSRHDRLHGNCGRAEKLPTPTHQKLTNNPAFASKVRRLTVTRHRRAG